jgi:predicted transcriptional regulator
MSASNKHHYHDVYRMRRMMAASLRANGFTYKKIGKTFGISSASAKYLVEKNNEEVLEHIKKTNRTANSPLFKYELVALQKVQDWLHFLTRNQND